MMSEILEEIIVPGTVSHICPLKMFTYPTRLSSAWRADIMEIQVPSYQIERPEIKITISQGSTASLGIKSGNIFRQYYQKLTPPLDLGEQYILDTRYETDGNIAHVVKNVSPSLMAVQHLAKHIPKITVILRKEASKLAQIAYEYLGCDVLCTDKSVIGRIIQGRTGKDGAYENYYRDWFGQWQFPEMTQDTPSKIFIARKGARTLINEKDVESYLENHGFQKVYYEDIPLSLQWSMTKNAKAIVALHGAALSSLVFNREQVKVVELFHPGYVTHAFRHMTLAVGGSWCGVIGQITEDVVKRLDFEQKPRYFASASTQIDLGSLKMALDHLEIGSEK